MSVSVLIVKLCLFVSNSVGGIVLICVGEDSG